jgi:serine/threonine protein kinase
MWQLANALRYMKSEFVVHRDMKLANVFLSEDMTVKIGDFGLAKTVTNFSAFVEGKCGTAGYMAPEVIKNQGPYSFEVDVWALGIFMYHMIVGRQPFHSDAYNNPEKRRDEIWK